jgi:hypothetical protein
MMEEGDRGVDLDSSVGKLPYALAEDFATPEGMRL